jgi:valyl-tRNA synthetase
VVADRAVDREFGTGVIKVTPAHDFTDNEIATRHGLAMKKIIDEDGKMMANCGKYAGLSTKDAREAIVTDMLALSLIDHIEDDYLHNAAVCYRCGSVIEPLPSRQWFVSVDKKLDRLGGLSLKEKALEAVKKNSISFLPSRFTKRYSDWMENLHDWCISRQIWFGHRVPVWYRGDEISVGETAPTGDGWQQDEDTLDTWFSSSLWTFSTLGWPENYQGDKKSGDLARFHPTQVLETGYEIITLWVSRMIMMSYFALGETPFKQVYLHGMILDNNGKKMSKSKGNGVDPLAIIKEFGADATRLSIITGSTPGNDARFSLDKVEAKRNLVNKLWNISRYILSEEAQGEPTPNSLADRWILTELDQLVIQTAKRLDNFEFSLAAEELQEFTWNKLADWYLEVSKIEKNKAAINHHILKTLLVLWHPFLPYVTEVIWRSFNDSLLLVGTWPEAKLEKDSLVETEFSRLQDIIIAIRNARSENRIEPAKKLEAIIYTGNQAAALEQQSAVICGLKTGLSQLTVSSGGEKPVGAIMIAVGEIEIYLLGAVDADKERERLSQEKVRLEGLVSRQRAKLENSDFVSRAPENIVLLEKDKLASYQAELEKISNIITSL